MGIKLKSLRPAVGTYGTVAANGIVEVDAAKADDLIKTGRFVKATADDVKAAQARQQDALAAAPGATVWTQVQAAGDGTPADDQPAGLDDASATAGDRPAPKGATRKSDKAE